MKYIITFQSTHQAIKAEKILKAGGFDLELIPTPRQISSECGFTILIYSINDNTLKLFLESKSLSSEKFYEVVEKNGEIKYEEIN